MASFHNKINSTIPTAYYFMNVFIIQPQPLNFLIGKKKFRMFRAGCLGAEIPFRHLYKSCLLSEVLTLAIAAGVGKICGYSDL